MLAGLAPVLKQEAELQQQLSSSSSMLLITWRLLQPRYFCSAGLQNCELSSKYVATNSRLFWQQILVAQLDCIAQVCVYRKKCYSALTQAFTRALLQQNWGSEAKLAASEQETALKQNSTLTGAARLHCRTVLTCAMRNAAAPQHDVPYQHCPCRAESQKPNRQLVCGRQL